MRSVNQARLQLCSKAVQNRVPDVSYPNLFVTRRFVPGVLKRNRVRYLGYALVLRLGVSVKVSGYG